jgi:protein translocase SecG subunit
MNVALTIILTVQMLSALGMIGLILVQHGKGADMGAAFGSGGSGSLFGASGSANFLSRTTAVLAAVFLLARWRWLTSVMHNRASLQACSIRLRRRFLSRQRPKFRERLCPPHLLLMPRCRRRQLRQAPVRSLPNKPLQGCLPFGKRVISG